MPTKTKLNKALSKKVNQAPHLIIEARAGTGKTTTLVEGLKILKGQESEFKPSPQQAIIWDEMAKSHDATSVCFVAFNKSIAEELQRRVPTGYNAMTLHSMGSKSVRGTFGSVQLNQNRTSDIIAEILHQDIWDIRRYQPEVLKATEKLVSLCKMNLTLDLLEDGVWVDEALQELAAHYDVELGDVATRVFNLVPQVIEQCKDVEQDRCINFDDMIWLPVALGLPTTKYDLLLVDEAQDLNRCQQQLAMKAGSRLVLCGDPKQAIYGFAGADSKSMARMEETLSETKQGVKTLPLTVTRRCGKAIVKEAQKIVPDFEAHKTCPKGRVARCPIKANGTSQTPYREIVEDGDMIICRVNAPLVSECFKFLRDGRKANIQGRDIGQGLISTINRLEATSIDHLLELLGKWLTREKRKENRSKHPSEARLIALQDRYDCLECFCEDQETVDDVTTKIKNVFTDQANGVGIRLSSVHKAKGLESNRVFLLMPEGAKMPHPMAKSDWAIDQEMNCLYVALTRAIKELVYVT